MKKAIAFLRSMKFGMLLLLLVIGCSLAGSLIVQQREPMEYVNRYGSEMAQVILFLQFDDVFSAPYFIVLMAALCLNLTLCSLVRLPRVMKAKKGLEAQANNTTLQAAISAKQANKLRAYFEKRRYRCAENAGRRVYTQNTLGYYGSFLTHLSFLLILFVGAGAVIAADVKDQTVMPGETITLSNGTLLTVESFQIEDETGRLDYASVVSVESADASKRVTQQIRVNEPLSFGGYKIYQQTYGTAGAVRIANLATGVSEDMALTESCFLTLDGRNGMFFNALYPGYVKAADGSVTLVTSTSGAYSEPVYDVISVADGAMTPVLAFPEETLTIGDVSFTMLDPISYPGLRIKHMPSVILALLYATFALMVVGLYLCFFMVPVAFVIEEEGYAVISPKTQTGLLIELEALLEEE